MTTLMYRRKNLLLYGADPQQLSVAATVLRLRLRSRNNRWVATVTTVGTLQELDALLATGERYSAVILYCSAHGALGGDEAAYWRLSREKLLPITCVVPGDFSDFEHKGVVVGYGGDLVAVLQYALRGKPGPRKQVAL